MIQPGTPLQSTMGNLWKAACNDHGLDREQSVYEKYKGAYAPKATGWIIAFRRGAAR